MSATSKIAQSGRRIREILDEIKSPDYEGGIYRITHTDIDGNTKYYADGAFLSEETAREIMTIFAENPHQHHQEYDVIPPLPSYGASFDIASP